MDQESAINVYTIDTYLQIHYCNKCPGYTLPCTAQQYPFFDHLTKRIAHSRN